MGESDCLLTVCRSNPSGRWGGSQFLRQDTTERAKWREDREHPNRGTEGGETTQQKP